MLTADAWWQLGTHGRIPPMLSVARGDARRRVIRHVAASMISWIRSASTRVGENPPPVRLRVRAYFGPPQRRFFPRDSVLPGAPRIHPSHRAAIAGERCRPPKVPARKATGRVTRGRARRPPDPLAFLPLPLPLLAPNSRTRPSTTQTYGHIHVTSSAADGCRV